jgi:hypothetical protein
VYKGLYEYTASQKYSTHSCFRLPARPCCLAASARPTMLRSAGAQTPLQEQFDSPEGTYVLKGRLCSYAPRDVRGWAPPQVSVAAGGAEAAAGGALLAPEPEPEPAGDTGGVLRAGDRGTTATMLHTAGMGIYVRELSEGHVEGQPTRLAQPPSCLALRGDRGGGGGGESPRHIVAVGLRSGECMALELLGSSGSGRVLGHWNKERVNAEGRCTAIAWDPDCATRFVVGFSSGSLLYYDMARAGKEEKLLARAGAGAAGGVSHSLRSAATVVRDLFAHFTQPVVDGRDLQCLSRTCSHGGVEESHAAAVGEEQGRRRRPPCGAVAAAVAARQQQSPVGQRVALLTGGGDGGGAPQQPLPHPPRCGDAGRHAAGVRAERRGDGRVPVVLRGAEVCRLELGRALPRGRGRGRHPHGLGRGAAPAAGALPGPLLLRCSLRGAAAAAAAGGGRGGGGVWRRHLPFCLRRVGRWVVPVGARAGCSAVAGGGESLRRVHWVAVPKRLRARRVNRRWRRRRTASCRPAERARSAAAWPSSPPECRRRGCTAKLCPLWSPAATG